MSEKTEKTPFEVATELENSVKEAQQKAEKAEEKAGNLESELEKANAKASDLEIELKSQKEAMAKFEDEFNKRTAEGATKGVESEVSLKSAIIDALEGKEFTSTELIELKATTASIVTPITNSLVVPGVNMPRTRQLAVIPTLRQRTLGKDKNTIVWLEGKYATQVGYVGEGEAQANSDTVTAGEKSRGLSKISAVIRPTREMYEDKSFIADELESQMYQKVMLWFEKEVISGVGADGENAKKIYGLKTHGTAFSATKAGVASSVSTPTLSDLVEAVKLQGLVVDVTDDTLADTGGFALDIAFVNPVDAMKWRTTKDNSGQYLLTRLSDGSQVMNGLRVIETTAIKANSMLAMESGVAELWTKRNFEITKGLQGDDLTEDRVTIVLFARVQTLVKDIDKAGVIFVENIDTALTALAVAIP